VLPSVGMNRQYRLDDSRWQKRTVWVERFRPGFAAFVAVLTGLVGFACLHILSVASVRWNLILALGLGLLCALIGYVVWGFPPYPDVMSVTASGLQFHRPNGSTFDLPLSPGVRLRLRNQFELVGGERRVTRDPTDVMRHSGSTEMIGLTREARDAVVATVLARGGVLESRRAVPFLKGVVDSVYRLPSSRVHV
jgi:hypothetical protein